MEAALCAKLGYGQHQRIAVVHRDTDHVHMHVAINKIHPKKLTIHNPYYDFDVLAKACTEVEQNLKLASTNHQPAGKTKGERRAKDIEALTGQESLHSWIHREVFENLRQAESWDALHGELAKAGLTLSLRGAGVVIASTNGHRITGSKLHRSFSKANLEKWLGPFQPRPEWCAAVRPLKEYRRTPIAPSNPLREEYEKAREAGKKTKKESLDRIALEYTRKKELIHAEMAADKARARALHIGRLQRRQIYSVIHEKRRNQLNQLHAETKKAKKKVYAECCSQSWVQWLQEQAQMGRMEAVEALRKRAFFLAKANGAALRGKNTITSGVIPGQKVDGITKHGTIIYDVGSDAVRDDGKSFRVSRGATQDTHIMALRMARRRFGDVIHVDGDRAFQSRMIRAAVEGKEYIKFADPAMERQRSELFRARHGEQKQQETRTPRKTEHGWSNTPPDRDGTAPSSRTIQADGSHRSRPEHGLGRTNSRNNGRGATR